MPQGQGYALGTPQEDLERIAGRKVAPPPTAAPGGRGTPADVLERIAGPAPVAAEERGPLGEVGQFATSIGRGAANTFGAVGEGVATAGLAGAQALRRFGGDDPESLLGKAAAVLGGLGEVVAGQQVSKVKGAREALKGVMDAYLPEASEDFADQVAEGIGSGMATIAMAAPVAIGAAAAAPVVALPLGAGAASIGAGSFMAGLGGALGAAGVGATSAMGETYWRAKAGGATEEEATFAGLKSAGVGLSEMAPIARFLRRLGGAKLGRSVVATLFREGAEEAVQEMGQQAAEGEIMDAWYAEPELWDILRTGAAAGLSGFLLSGATVAATARARREQAGMEARESLGVSAQPGGAANVPRGTVQDQDAVARAVSGGAPVVEQPAPAGEPFLPRPQAEVQAERTAARGPVPLPPAQAQDQESRAALQELARDPEQVADDTDVSPKYAEGVLRRVTEMEPAKAAAWIREQMGTGADRDVFLRRVLDAATVEERAAKAAAKVMQDTAADRALRAHKAILAAGEAAVEGAKPERLLKLRQEAEAARVGGVRPVEQRGPVSPIASTASTRTPQPAPARVAQAPQESPAAAPFEPPAGRPQSPPTVAEEAQPLEALPSEAIEAGAVSEPIEDTEAAAPIEPPPTVSEQTSVRNARVDLELEEMGLPPAEHGERVEFERLNEEAEALLAKDPHAGTKLLDDLERTGRPALPLENAIMLRERNRIRLERDRLKSLMVEAVAKGEPTDDIARHVEKIREEFARASDIATKTGTVTAQSLATRRMEMKDDYSLAAMERDVMLARGGLPIPPALAARIADLHSRVWAAEARFNEYLAGEKATIALRAELRERRRSQRQEAKATSRKRIDELWSKLAEQAPRARAGLDVDTLAAVTELAVEYAKLGFVSAEQLADDIGARLGDGFRHYAEPAWAAAMQAPALKAYKTRKANELAALSEKLAGGDLAPKVRRHVVLDEEAVRLKADVEAVKRQFAREVERERLAHRTRGERAKDLGAEALDLTKAIKTAWDLSAVLRQGGFLSLGDPAVAAESLKTTLATFTSEARTLDLDTKIRNRQLAAFGEKSGLELTRHGDDIGKHEEAIRSQLSDRIPGLTASNRAFVTFLNLQRAATFDAMVQAIPGTPTLEQGRAIANFVNVATGRGNPGKAAGAVRVLSHVLWSPRLLLSRFQLLGQPFVRGDATTRKLIAQRYARTLTGLAAVYALASLAGADREDDPRSSDFGKIRFGNTRLDPLFGLSQVSVLLGTLATGETKKLSGEIESMRGPKARMTAAEKIGRFLRTKLSPTLGTAINWLSGEDPVGNPAGPDVLAKGLQEKPLETALSMGPLAFSDIHKAMQEQGVPAGMALAMLSIFGMSLQTFEQKSKAKK